MADPALAGRYRYVRELGRGASGRVILAEDAVDRGALRALKVVGSGDAARLGWEFDTLHRLAHPNVAAVHELLRIDRRIGGAFRLERGTVVLVEEHVAGEPADRIADRLADPGARLAFVLAAGQATARGLAAIHALGLVHGDVKPSNIVATERGDDAKLIDLGLAHPPGAADTVSGTPAFLAPEAWQGDRSLGTDLWALGATLHHLLGGQSPVSETRSQSIAEMVTQSLSHPRSVESLPASVPATVRRLVASLLDPDPARRPSTAREVAARLSALASDLDLTDATGGGVEEAATPTERAMAMSALPLVARERELSALIDAIREERIVVVRGPPGSGRTRLVREAMRAIQRARATAGDPVPTFRHAHGELPRELPERDAVVHVERADGVEIGAARAAVEAAALMGARISLVLERTQPSSAEDTKEVRVDPVGRGAIETLLAAALEGVRPSGKLIDAAMRASAGLPGRLCTLIADAIRMERDPSRPDTLSSMGAREDEGEILLPEGTRAAAAALAIAGGSLPSGTALDALLAPALPRLVAAGLATVGADGALRLRTDAARALRARATEPERRALVEAVDAAALPIDAAAFVHAARGEEDRALRAFLDAIGDRRRSGDPEGAAQLAEDATELLGPSAALGCARADALRAAGRYDDALEALGSSSTPEVELARSEILRLSGRPDESASAARHALEGLVEGDGRARAHASLARIALDAGRLDDASAHLRDGAEALAVGDGARARLAEVGALVALYRGEADEAGARASTAVDAARRALDRAAESRAVAVQALLHQHRGEIRAAARLYVRAFELADGAGEAHAAATFLVNVGLARLDAGEPGPAIAALRDGARRLARLRRDRDLSRALYNVGLAAVLIGDDDLAASAVRHAREAAARCGDTEAEAYATILEAEMALRAGSLGAAREATERVRARIEGAGARVRAVVAARTAMILAALGDRAGAARAVADATEAAGRDASDAARTEAAVAQARVALLSGDAAAAHASAAAARAHAERSDAYEGRLRALLVSADAAEARGDGDEARRWLGEARALLDTAASTLTPSERARLRDVPAYAKALASVPRAPAVDGDQDARWRRLALLARRLTAERRVGRLYEEIVDAAVELSGAERGFLILRDAEGRLRVRTSRGLLPRAAADEALEQEFSRSIAARAIDAGQTISTVDALRDERMDGAASVHALSLRSVMAVPLRRRGDVGAAIYLEDRLRPGAFDPVSVALVSDLADIASIALDGADMLRTERRSARRLAAMRRKLARTVETQAIEIASLKRTQMDPASAVPGIVAHSQSMRRALDLVLRVAEADVPVLVTGESGTGKELVARAIHDRSTRREAAFVSENCGAIPEPLLESALFGHVRGAFTGADRGRIGLFEAADGGTLFLDEIGEMSPAMQAKLLRVAQDGEVRPVGSERTLRVNVRIVAATHRDLDEMVRRGDFREDLYYRLAVVTVPIPPLRERPDDIAPLVAHFTARHAPGRNVRFDRRALARLASYTWPGNVRQLENEVQRAIVLGSDVIREEDLSPAVRGDEAGVPDELDLKAQITALERRLIRRALDASDGNQTQAAKLLGVSRYGLQKMLKRLGV